MTDDVPVWLLPIALLLELLICIEKTIMDAVLGVEDLPYEQRWGNKLGTRPVPYRPSWYYRGN